MDTTATKFFPLKTGNSWVFQYTIRYFGIIQSTEKYRAVVLSDTIINSKKYYFINNLKYISPATELYRIDSSNGVFTKYTICTIDSLGEQSHNNYYQTCFDNINVKFFSSGSIELFGVQTIDKLFMSVPVPRLSKSRKYVKGFGPYYYHITDDKWNYEHTLTGCVIDGVLYGDTTTTLSRINQINSEIPNSFTLSQNYPNPFNPVTKIRFEIPKSEYVKITVFDMLGKEIAALVNQQLQPGTYESEWDGSSYSSGIYYYKIIAGDFIETKKMILVK